MRHWLDAAVNLPPTFVTAFKITYSEQEEGCWAAGVKVLCNSTVYDRVYQLLYKGGEEARYLLITLTLLKEIVCFWQVMRKHGAIVTKVWNLHVHSVYLLGLVYIFCRQDYYEFCWKPTKGYRNFMIVPEKVLLLVQQM